MRLQRFVVLILLATPACMTTRRVAPAEYLAQYRPAEMLVVDNAGRPWLLEQPEIVGDKVVGLRSGTPITVSVPVAQVQEAIVRRKSPARTALLVGTLAAIGGVVAIAASSGGSGEPCKLIWDVSEEITGARSQCDNLGPDGGPLP
jgi:hypothetical protein